VLGKFCVLVLVVVLVVIVLVLEEGVGGDVNFVEGRDRVLEITGFSSGFVLSGSVRIRFFNIPFNGVKVVDLVFVFESSRVIVDLKNGDFGLTLVSIFSN
jgi:hypothetical protein